jgi:polyisoprenoid-binding protein YceI
MIKNAIAISSALLLIGAGVLGYAFFKTPAAATAPIAAVLLATSTIADASSAAAEPSAGTVVFEIVPAESQASFQIDELLRGALFTVVGTTDQVAGQVAVDPSDPASAQLGTIQINARTLATDDERRDRAIANRILLTDAHEYITFTPTAITGLPATATVGASYTFTVSGDLTITDQTRSVAFDVVLTPQNDAQLSGLRARHS